MIIASSFSSAFANKIWFQLGCAEVVGEVGLVG
jgi:hypothetical protein